MAATKAGDLDTILSLMTDDVAFPVPGQPVMRRAEFAAAAKSMAGSSAPKIDGKSAKNCRFVAAGHSCGRD